MKGQFRHIALLHGGFVVRLKTRSMDFPSERPVRHADGIAYIIRADIVDSRSPSTT
jgi:hypothetical protein